MKKFTSIFHEAEISINEKSEKNIFDILNTDVPSTYESYAEKSYPRDIINRMTKLIRSEKKMLSWLKGMIKNYENCIKNAKSKREKAPDKYEPNFYTAMATAAGQIGCYIDAKTFEWDKRQWDKIIKDLESNKKVFESEAKKYERKVQKESSYLDFELI